MNWKTHTQETQGGTWGEKINHRIILLFFCQVKCCFPSIILQRFGCSCSVWRQKLWTMGWIFQTQALLGQCIRKEVSIPFIDLGQIERSKQSQVLWSENDVNGYKTIILLFSDFHFGPKCQISTGREHDHHKALYYRREHPNIIDQLFALSSFRFPKR